MAGNGNFGCTEYGPISLVRISFLHCHGMAFYEAIGADMQIYLVQCHGVAFNGIDVLFRAMGGI